MVVSISSCSFHAEGAELPKKRMVEVYQFSPMASWLVSKALQGNKCPCGKGKPLMLWCHMLARQAWELIALPELPKQKEQVQKDKPATFRGRRCATFTRPLT